MLGTQGNIMLKMAAQSKEKKLNNNTIFNKGNTLKRRSKNALKFKKSSKKARFQKQRKIQLEDELELVRTSFFILLGLAIIIPILIAIF